LCCNSAANEVFFFAVYLYSLLNSFLVLNTRKLSRRVPFGCFSSQFKPDQSPGLPSIHQLLFLEEKRMPPKLATALQPKLQFQFPMFHFLNDGSERVETGGQTGGQAGGQADRHWPAVSQLTADGDDASCITPTKRLSRTYECYLIHTKIEKVCE
jgi:hypothetical protein